MYLTGHGKLHHLRESGKDVTDGATLACQVKLVHPLLLYKIVLVSRHGNGTQVAVSNNIWLISTCIYRI